MRRALLTATAFLPAVPLVVGEQVGGSLLNANSARVFLSPGITASRSGTITTVNYRFGRMFTARFLTGTFSGGTFTVRAMSPNFGTVANSGQESVSLSVEAGDVIGVWASIATQVGYASSSGRMLHFSTSSATPGPGVAYSMTGGQNNANLELSGTG